VNNGVVSGRNVLAADGKVRVRYECGGFIRASPPHLSKEPVRHKSCGPWRAAGVVHLHGLSIRELALGIGRRAGTWFFIAAAHLRGRQDRKSKNSTIRNAIRFCMRSPCGKAFSICQLAFASRRLGLILGPQHWTFETSLRDQMNVTDLAGARCQVPNVKCRFSPANYPLSPAQATIDPMPVFDDKQEVLEHYETMMGVPRAAWP